MPRAAEPIHPGRFLAELIVECGLTQHALARAISVQPIRIHQIVAGVRSISPDTALRLARYFGADARSWMNWQAQYDLEVARREMGARIERSIRPMKRAA